VIKHYIGTNAARSEGRALYIDPKIIHQMLAMIEKFNPTEMLKLKCMMNFGVSEKTFHKINRALKMSKDAAYNSRLTEKYEDHFFADLD
jgi:hypothetical protein